MDTWDMSFKLVASTIEPCPYCGCEVVISGDGTSSCSACGHPDVLPCTECCIVNDMEMCDWNPDTRCTPFFRVGDSNE